MSSVRWLKRQIASEHPQALLTLPLFCTFLALLSLVLLHLHFLELSLSYQLANQESRRLSNILWLQDQNSKRQSTDTPLLTLMRLDLTQSPATIDPIPSLSALSSQRPQIIQWQNQKVFYALQTLISPSSQTSLFQATSAPHDIFCEILLPLGPIQHQAFLILQKNALFMLVLSFLIILLLHIYYQKNRFLFKKQFFLKKAVRKLGKLRRNNRQLTQHAKSHQRELAHVRNQLQNLEKQLIAQEKFISLGLLSAGIAHELKNPLNFIKNFSELNQELLQELKTHMQIGNIALSSDLSQDLESLNQNATKIVEHTQRCESIIQHINMQRNETSPRSLTDINRLLEDYYNLAYHGIRAQNNKYNIKIEKNLASGLPLINISAADIGRVFLNIIHNAIYAANEKPTSPNFMPTLILSTMQDAKYIVIRIKDNGIGISPEVQKQMFKAFFTTKPLGIGTGLGLFICETIIKEHKGMIEINSKVGEFSEFIIKLPKTS